jgi:hypothetical protein
MVDFWMKKDLSVNAIVRVNNFLAKHIRTWITNYRSGVLSGN